MSYRLTAQVDLKEIRCVMTQLVHEESGARILHLGNDDPENLFCLAFQTLPRRSDGAPHILEHTVLCGSEKYPVKDPFFGMIRRSLNTFMNAMTGDDITFYPAASQVEKDFYNLLDVYIDSVFFPKLSRLSFLQEGHRLELSNPEDVKSSLVRKGVVYNEMKGAMASADSRAWHCMMKELFPDTPYQFNSGGDPKVIPQLTHSELLEFHRTFYHPSRCLFFFYGNLPLEGHLEYLHDRLLKQAQRVPPLPPMPTQDRFKTPLTVRDAFPIAPSEELAGKGMILFGYLTARIRDPEEVIALGILDMLLTGTDASPLKLALLKSGLCKDAYSFLSADMADVPFIIGCKGCEETAAEALQELIQKELLRLEKEEFPPEQLEAAIHQFEFSRLEIKGGSAPYGLSLFQRSGPLVLLDVDPLAGLTVHTLFKRLRERLSQPGALGQLIRKYFLDNGHRCRLVMVPDRGLAAREEEAEKEELERIKEGLTPEQIEKIIADSQALEEFQERLEEQELEVLPRIAISDVSREPQDFSLHEGQAGPLRLFHHDCFTNDIVYAALHYDLPHLEEEELPYAELFTSMLTEVGAGGRSYTEQLDYLMAHIGGLGAGLSLNPRAGSPIEFRPAMSVTGKALERKADRLFPLFGDLITSADFTDTSRLRELVIQIESALQHSLPSQGLRYATSLATAPLSPSARISDACRGFRFLQRVRLLASDLDSQIPLLQKKLEEFRDRLLGVGTGDLVLSYSAQQLRTHERHQFYGLESLRAVKAPIWQVPLMTDPRRSQGRIIASPVAFTCKAMEAIPYTHPDAPLIAIATRLFEHKVLHPIIREQGGAYGSGAAYSPAQALLYFYSYRDPNLSTTLQAFDEAVAMVENGEFNGRQLEEAKLTLIQKADTPVSPGSRGSVAYGWRKEQKSKEMRQGFRTRLLEASIEECARAVREHIAPRVSNAVVVSCAGQELLERENKRLACPLEILPL